MPTRSARRRRCRRCRGSIIGAAIRAIGAQSPVRSTRTNSRVSSRAAALSAAARSTGRWSHWPPVAFRHYSPDYLSAEESAAKRGLRAGTFETPETHRHPADSLNRHQPANALPAKLSRPERSGECSIKGTAIATDDGTITCRACPIRTRHGPKKYSAASPKSRPPATVARLCADTA